MTGPLAVRTRVLAKGTVELVGRDRRHDRVIAGVLARFGVRHHRAVTRGWLVHPADADDAMAALEHDGHRIEAML